jgi:hypothetical protein
MQTRERVKNPIRKKDVLQYGEVSHWCVNSNAYQCLPSIFVTPEGGREACEDENNAEDSECRVKNGVLITDEMGE